LRSTFEKTEGVGGKVPNRIWAKYRRKNTRIEKYDGKRKKKEQKGDLNRKRAGEGKGARKNSIKERERGALNRKLSPLGVQKRGEKNPPS